MRIRTFAAFTTVAVSVAACSDKPPTAAPNFPTDIQAALASGYQPLIITPTVDTVEVGKSIQLHVKLPGEAGDTTKDSSGDATVYWGANDLSIASVRGGKITGRKPGKISVVALTSNAVGLATVVVRPASNDDATNPSPSENELGALASGYSMTSPHWSHIRTLTTDFYYHWTPEEREWAGQHFDAALSGSTEAWHAVNATVTQLPYTLFWTLLMPGENSQPFLSSTYYGDMKEWFENHPQYRLEDAFLHASNPRTKANRLTAHIWDSNRWMINPSDPGARAYTIDRYRRLAKGADGVFIDEASSGDIIPRVRGAVEFQADRYEADYTSLLAEVKRELGDKVVMLNTAEYTKRFDRANAVAAGAVHLELFNNPLRSQISERWRWIEELRSLGVQVNMSSPYAATWADAHSDEYPKGNYSTSGQRLRMWELASYYMVVGQSPEGLTFHLRAPSYDTAPSDYWLPAIEANIGHPTGPRSVKAEGVDPTGQPYTIYQRDFDRALVLIRTQRGWGEQNYRDGTAVKVSLPSGETWLPLHADGTLGSAVTSVKLRNSEAVILVKRSKL